MNFWSILIICLISRFYGIHCSYNGTTCTADICKINESILRFFHIGDWGGQDTPPYVTPAQRTVAKTMNRLGEEKRVHFVLSVGDHFYTSGPTSVTDHRFKATFDDVFTFGKSTNVPWYMTAGNHDYYGDIAAQLNYSRLNPRWIYPDLSYVVRYELVPTSTTIDFISVDTVVLCGGTSLGAIDPKTGKRKEYFDLVRGPDNPAKAEALWSWLREKLSKSRADYLFVVSHYPLFSGGAHGDFIHCPRERMNPLLEEFNVTAYLFGHDHNLQHLTCKSKNGRIVHHILSGGGNSLDKRRRPLNTTGADVTIDFFYPQPDQHRLPNTENVGGFVYAKIQRDNGTFRYYTGDGNVLYEVHVHPRHSVLRSNKSVVVYYRNDAAASFDGMESAILAAVLVSGLLFIG